MKSQRIANSQVNEIYSLGTYKSVEMFVSGVVMTFYFRRENFDLLVALDGESEITKVIMFLPHGTVAINLIY